MRRSRIGRFDEKRARPLRVIQRIRHLGLLGEDRGIGIGRIGAPLPSLRKMLNHGGGIGLAGAFQWNGSARAQ
jgi:hypothetical protein